MGKFMDVYVILCSKVMIHGEFVIDTESLIPFGWNKETRKLVDVASVPRGSKCGCICPSCNTPLIARQGESKEWHFAHRSRNVHKDTNKDCEYSFAVSVRLMIRQLSSQGLKFRTPRYGDKIEAYGQLSHQRHRIEYIVTEGSTIELSNPKIGSTFSRVTVDVLSDVKKVPFVVYISYKGRNVPPEINPPDIKRCGVVELNISDLPNIFKQERKGRYLEVLREYIEETTGGKSWVYHPKMIQARKQAEEEMTEWLSQQKSNLSCETENNPIRSSNTLLSVSPAKPDETVIPVIHYADYECVGCGTSLSRTLRNCPECGTELHT
jgi:ssDNA-binding Zn-finger/Zn-ribbon topoisomerase 1